MPIQIGYTKLASLKVAFMLAEAGNHSHAELTCRRAAETASILV